MGVWSYLVGGHRLRKITDISVSVGHLSIGRQIMSSGTWHCYHRTVRAALRVVKFEGHELTSECFCCYLD